MTFATTKPKSSCCGAPMKENVRDGGYFCTKCVKQCGMEKAKPVYSTISSVRKVTGEGELFLRIWGKRPHRSEISNAKLVGPEHELFTHQFSHILCKNNYPDYRLREDNVVLVTKAEHDYWTQHPKACRNDPKWRWVWKIYDAHKLEAETKRHGGK